eukprot:jgi/Psemu1/10254/gm1.10254_g
MLDVTHIAVGCFAFIDAILSLMTVLAMTVPLLFPKERKTYSTYNLYLAYLSASDLIFKAFLLYLVFGYKRTNQFNKIHDHDHDHAMSIFCVTANLYTNAFLAYEIYMLLLNSSRLIRHKPPSIGKVTTQAMISYGCGIVYLLLDTFALEGHLDDDSTTDQWKKNALVISFLFLCAGIPMLVVVGVCFQIWRLELLGSTRTMFEGRLRTLALYFARIVCVYVLIWLPAFVCYTIHWVPSDLFSEEVRERAYTAAAVLIVLEVFVSFGFSWTKPDVQRLYVNFFTLQYCRCHNNNNSNNSNNSNNNNNQCSAETTETDPQLQPCTARKATEATQDDSSCEQEDTLDDLEQPVQGAAARRRSDISLLPACDSYLSGDFR